MLYWRTGTLAYGDEKKGVQLYTLQGAADGGW